MDFEEQLEKAEKLSSPSLVGSSMRSADDSPHRNYIHPEKYESSVKPKRKSKKSTLLNSAIGASLDDLISEGALLGSEEDFEKFLDKDGRVLSEAKSKNQGKEATSTSPIDESKSETSSTRAKVSPSKIKEDFPADQIEKTPESDLPVFDKEVENPQAKKEEEKPQSTLYQQEDYSTPNLSEYQLGNQIKNHDELLKNIKSYDVHKLPSSNDREFAKSNAMFAKDPSKINTLHTSSNARDHNPVNDSVGMVNLSQREIDLHTPYFYSDSRGESRSRSRARSSHLDRERSDRSRSRSAASTPHLARGDSYKNVHTEQPSTYELPAGMEAPEEQKEEEEDKDEDKDDEDDRRTRQTRPTMGESIAAAEAKKDSTSEDVRPESESLTREPSLVTTGDYTNFNADGRDPESESASLYSVRSQSATNYLRSISRSRSRQPTGLRKENLISEQSINEKNDADPSELENEGALVSDDPYVGIGGFNPMVQEALHTNDRLDTQETSIKEELNEDLKEEREELKEEVKGQPEVVVTSLKEDEPPVDPPSVSEEKEEDISNLDTEEPQEEKAEQTDDKLDEDDIPKDAAGTAAGQAAEAVATTSVINEPEAEEETASEAGPKSLKKVEDKVDDKEVADVPAEEREKIAQEQLVAEKAPAVSSKDIEVEEPGARPSQTTVEEPKESELEVPVDEAEGDIKDTDAPVVSAADIKVPESKEESEDTEKETEETKDSENVEETTDELKKVNEEESEVSTGGADEAPSTKELLDSDLPEKVDEQVGESLEKPEESITVEGDEENVKTETKEPVEESEAKEPDVETKEPDVESTKQAVADEDDDFYDVSPEEIRKHLESQPVYIFTSFAGGMQIIPRTNRLGTILQANGIKFELRDLGTDEEAKKIWKRNANGKTMPGVVRGDDFIGNWQDIEEANEEYKVPELIYETL